MKECVEAVHICRLDKVAFWRHMRARSERFPGTYRERYAADYQINAVSGAGAEVGEAAGRIRQIKALRKKPMLKKN